MNTSQLIDTAERSLPITATKACGMPRSRGLPSDLWQQLVENGFHQLGSNSGTETKTYLPFESMRRYAVPLPMAEILLANCWGPVRQCGFASIGTQGDSLVGCLGRQASPVLR